MVDVHSRSTRSYNMSRIRGTNTEPELIVRRLLHHLGFRFRLHRRDLPGTPDIVLPRSRTVIFVHGCFWHQHPRCRYATKPATRSKFWQKKFEANRGRDRKAKRRLRAIGWKVMIIWECQTVRGVDQLATKLNKQLIGSRRVHS